MDPFIKNVLLKCLPIPAIKEIANLLDPPGVISIETFCDILQTYSRRRGLDLKMTPAWIAAIRWRTRISPTEYVFDHLRTLRVTIGDVWHVLVREMGTATEDIFRNYKGDILHFHNSCDAQEDHCMCPHCQRPDLISDPPSYRRSTSLDQGQRSSRANRVQRPDVGASAQRSSFNWEPPTCDCQENYCDICEQTRLRDPDETVLLSPHSMASQRLNMLSSRPSRHTLNVRVDVAPTDQLDHEDDVRTDNISYSENPSESHSLRCVPDGSSMRGDYFVRNKQTCPEAYAKNQKQPVCTCRKVKRQARNQEPRCSDMIYKRNSAPPEGSSFLEQESRSSNSDPNLSTLGQYCTQSCLDESKKILITYTDDAKDDMIALASDLKGQGHTVNTDLQLHTFMKAKNQGLVSEKDQYMWLKKKYMNADFIIVCSSKCYGECLNSRQAVPSISHLNAKYIYELMSGDPNKSRKIIDVSFGSNNFCVDYKVKQFVLPRETKSLYDHICYMYD